MKKTSYLLIPIALIGAFIGYQVFGPTVKAPEAKYLYIKTGSTYEDVLNSLKEENVIDNGFFFKKMISQSNYKNNVKPGKYEIKKGMSIYSLIKMLKSGRQTAVKLVINKLRTTEDLAAKIGKSFETDSLKTIQFLRNKDSLAILGVDSHTVMSAVIPNTYEINWNSSLTKIFSKLKTEQEKFWNESRKQKAAAKKLSPLQVYILASIVEEETNATADKPLIASVYKNRFIKGEKLQADPTVKFALKDFGLKRILFKHLEFVSPYNTYKNVGLPPGPICSPSSKTIDAVLDAPETDFMFFVAKPDLKGYSNFAVTYAEHQIFAKQYQDALDNLIRSRK